MTSFTLFSGESIRPSKKQKVIPAEDYATLLDIDSLLVKVRENSETYKKQVVAECEKQKEAAAKEGYQEGMEQWVEAIAALQNRIEEVRDEMHKKISPLALMAAKKLVNKELELSPETITDIICKSLKSVSGHRQITIYVNKNDLQYVEENKQKLRDQFERLESLAVTPSPEVDPGGCIIETEAGIINAQLDNQWKMLEKAFEALTKDPDQS